MRFVAAAVAVVSVAIAGASGRAPTEAAGGAVAACDAVSVERLVRTFVDAFNAGDRDRLARVWPRAMFRRFAVTGTGTTFAARKQTELLRYFAERHRRGERLRLDRVQPTRRARDAAGFRFEVTWTAHDGKGARYQGSGAAHCRAKRAGLAVWTMREAAPPARNEPPRDVEALVAALRRAGVTINPLGSERGHHLFPGAVGRYYGTPTGHLTAWEFATEADALRAAASVSRSGYEIRSESAIVHVDWISPPHWFRSGRLLVLYVRGEPVLDDGKTLAILRSVLGREFAGAGG